ncbi:MAG: L-histidine N(alpha)-methyltransferase, partial [Isosphaeraceae bacterium]|nr:L-histidine N(alpha)-methyltransferase [Isosphaeraceae bacterium]
SFAEAVRRGLTAHPKTLPCQYFYDAAGSLLFEQICELPEYYLTRTEDAILREHAGAMVAGWDRPLAMIELGSGSSTKTRRLIAAALAASGALHYIPIDVSPTILDDSARRLVRDFSGLFVTGYAADYRAALAALSLRIRGPKLIVFLGSSLGNYEADDAVALLSLIARALSPNDRLLLGVDLAKDRASLEAAYDDAQGVTAQFNLNLLARINRELGGNFDLDRFSHRATYHPDRSRVEMHLISLAEQTVMIPGASLVVRLAAGESIHTENSHKYTTEALHDLARRSGFIEEMAWTDPAGLFRVQRWRPVSGS